MQPCGKGAFEQWLVGVVFDDLFDEQNGDIILVLAFEVADVVFQLAHGFVGLCHAQVKFNQLFARSFIFRGEGADLFVDAQGLFPVQSLQVDIGHALQDVGVPVAVGAAVLNHTQGGGVGFACHVQFCEAIVDGGQFKIFLHGIIDLSTGYKLFDQAVA